MIEDDGATLQLCARLQPSGPVRGALANGQAATLFRLRGSRSRAGPYVLELQFGTAVVGMTLAGLDDACLTGAVARLSGLEQAIGTSGLSLTTSDITSRREPHATVEWQPTETIEVPLRNATLKLDDYVHFGGDSEFNFELTHRAQAILVAESPLSLDRIDELIDILWTFVSFATEAQVHLRSLRVTRGTSSAAVIAHHRQRYGPMPEGAGDPWLTLGALEDPATMVAGFYRFAEEQPAAYLILFELLVSMSELNPIDKLLYLARFLEVYHRTRFPGDRDPPEIHDERVALVKAATTPKHKRWAGFILHHSNEVFFKERLLALIDGPAVAAKPVLGATPEEFAKVVGDSRNYWTHYSDELSDKALRDVALDDLDDRLLLLARACVLDHMGLTAEDAQTFLRQDWRWRLATKPL